ncbi:MAG: sodium-translocating pyrophosphatase [Parcubacteria group bacterium]|nr:sodium-translocating pyrophosphatase [Parcubacteria group bacterium]
MSTQLFLTYFPLASAGLALVYGVFLIRWVLAQPAGTEEMQKISRAIQEGSSAYLNRQYRTVGIVAIPIFLLLYWFLGLGMAAGFIVGAVFSALAGYVGMNIAVRSNSRTAEAARTGLKEALNLAFRGGAVTGFFVVSLGLASVTGFFLLAQDLRSLIGLGFGASLISVFARLGGGIYTKSADVGADLVGKVEAGIPEDDPRNPAVIADNVGDNVGDCAGMAADLFETYAVTTIAAMVLAGLLFPQEPSAVFYPLAMGGVAILASILGSLFVRLDNRQSIMAALYKGLIAAALFSALGFWFLTRWFVTDGYLELWLAGLIGLGVTAFMVIITEYYTAKKYRPVKQIALSSNSGHGTNVIMGLSIGLEATALPIVVIVAGTLAAYSLLGLYGIAIAAVAMLSLAGIIVAIDSFGPITDNAGGIAEMTNLPEEVRNVTDALDAVGNTTKAVTKGYAIASAGLAALVLFSAYSEELGALGRAIEFELQDPNVLAGIFLGAMLPYLFSSLAMRAVSKAAQGVVEEVRRQFREIPGIMQGTTKPEYGTAVDIVTSAALREMIFPAILPVATVLFAGWLLGAKGVGGLLIGALVAGLFVALSMTSGGAAWDNAKKFIEEGNYGGKKSQAHQAAVTGDTVGDAYKDTAGPAINPMIKVVNIVALLIVRFLK